ncbi:MAG: sulfatase family protein [Saccharofermentanales bacterium]
MKNKPDILILMCDQLNARAIGCYGGAVPTPHIDRLAKEGVLFTNSTCAYPICSPSRASIITGQYAHKHGLIHNCMKYDYLQDELPDSEEGIKKSDITTESILNGIGYETHHYGKWHLLGEKLPYYPDMYLEHFQYADEMKEKFVEIRKHDSDKWMDWYGWALPVKISEKHRSAMNSIGDRWDDLKYADLIKKAGRLEMDIKDTFDDRVVEKTISAIKKYKHEPFMITCSFNDPHDPNVIPSPYYELFDPDDIAFPANKNVIEKQFENDWSRELVSKPGDDALKELMRIYYAQVKFVDDEVGRILAVLDEEGLTNNTVVIFIADHGDMMGGHGMFWKSSFNLYDEIVRVPCIIRYPDKILPDICDAPLSGVDIMPTLFSLCGQNVPSFAQGYDFAPFLTGKGSLDDAPEYSFCERLRENPDHIRIPYERKAGGYMIRGKKWKYIRYVNDKDEILYDYLYNLEKDPHEIDNLADKQECSEIVSGLSLKIDEWLSGTK